MPKPTMKQRVVSVTKIVVTTIGVLGSVEIALAQEPQRMVAASASELSSAKLTNLEHAFWVCDYVATTRGGSDVPTCTAVYEAVKQLKFGGDFDKLVAWWRQNKVAQHRNIAVADTQ